MKAHLVIVGIFFFIFGKGYDGKKIISNRDTGLFSKKYQLGHIGLDHSFRPKIVSYNKWNSWNWGDHPHPHPQGKTFGT